MVKGRKYNPSTEQTGNWYKHSTCNDFLRIGSRSDVTSTGSMTALNGHQTTHVKSAPPLKFYARVQDEYSNVNPFSNHDNRNNLQAVGEYFGDGKKSRVLGRKLAANVENQHHTPTNDFLMHHGREMTDSFFYSNYMLSHEKKSAPSAEHRRFPRRYNSPSSGKTELPTSTVNQFTTESGQLPYRTPTQTLISSLEPFLRKNRWKCAYHSRDKYDIYPKVRVDKPAHKGLRLYS